MVVDGEEAHTVHSKASLFSFMIFEMLFILSSNGHNIMQHAQAFNKFLSNLHTDKKGG